MPLNCDLWQHAMKLSTSIVDPEYKEDIQTSCILSIGIYQTCATLEVLFCLYKHWYKVTEQVASQFETLKLKVGDEHCGYRRVCTVVFG